MGLGGGGQGTQSLAPGTLMLVSGTRGWEADWAKAVARSSVKESVDREVGRRGREGMGAWRIEEDIATGLDVMMDAGGEVVNV